jgi:hypothetical protein
MDRVLGQLLNALKMLEQEASPDWFTGEDLMQPQITLAVAWYFIQHNSPDLVPARDFPKLSVLSERAEKLEPFRETAY